MKRTAMKRTELKPAKQKRCDCCGELFACFSSFDKCKRPGCAVKPAEMKRSTLQPKSTKVSLRIVPQEKPAAPATRSSRRDRADAAFNAFICERDRFKPCVSCGLPPGETLQAGHYRTRGAATELRFHPLNCHGQCAHCNCDLSGNRKGYDEGILERISADELAWLKGPHPAQHWTNEDFLQIEKHYKAEKKQLLAGGY